MLLLYRTKILKKNCLLLIAIYLPFYYAFDTRLKMNKINHIKKTVKWCMKSLFFSYMKLI